MKIFVAVEAIKTQCVLEYRITNGNEKTRATALPDLSIEELRDLSNKQPYSRKRLVKIWSFSKGWKKPQSEDYSKSLKN